MTAILNALSQSRLVTPLGFLALAAAFLSAALASAAARLKASFSVAAVIFFGLAVASFVYGPVKTIDAGVVLGYTGLGAAAVTLGIGAMSGSPRLGWVLIIVGLALAAIAGLLVHRAGLF